MSDSVGVWNNVDQWIAENRAHFLPPVCNKLMHSDQLKVFYVGGPNQRKDFHLEQGEELFYMAKGDMELVVLERGQFRTVTIRQGQVFLLPAKIPHSPQRQADTIGLVVERERLGHESDCLRYYVEGSSDALFERWFYCDDLGVQLVPIIREFFASEECRTGRPTASLAEHAAKASYQPDRQRQLEAPFDLAAWLVEHRPALRSGRPVPLFDAGRYETRVLVHGPCPADADADADAGLLRRPEDDHCDVWLWQLEGESTVVRHDGGRVAASRRLAQGDTLLIGRGRGAASAWRLAAPTSADSALLSVVMDPGRKLD